MIISRETCSPPKGAKGNLANHAKVQFLWICLTQISRISQKLHRRKLAATIRRVHSVCNTDSKGEATCLREICEICVRPKSMMQENFAFFARFAWDKKLVKREYFYNAFSLQRTIANYRHRGGSFVSPRWLIYATAVMLLRHRGGVFLSPRWRSHFHSFSRAVLSVIPMRRRLPHSQAHDSKPRMSQNHRYLQFIIGAAKANRFMNFRHIEKPYSHGEKIKKRPFHRVLVHSFGKRKEHIH